MAWKIVLKFNTLQGGFSEVWATGDETNPDSTNTAAIQGLWKKRLALCGKGATLLGVRISLVKARPRPTYNLPLGSGGVFSSPVTADNTTYGSAYAANQTPDQLQTCIQLQCYAQGGARKPVYLAGIPDDIIVTNPNGPNVTTDTQWNNNFIAWVSFLQTNKFGWIGKAYQGAYAPISIAAWVSAAAPLPGLWAVVNGGLPAGILQGAKVQVMGTRMANKALRSPNGTYTCAGTGVYTPGVGQNYAYFPQLNGIDPTQVATLGQLQAVAQFGVFYQLVSVFPTRQGSHKRGRFFGEYRGRVSKPARV